MTNTIPNINQPEKIDVTELIDQLETDTDQDSFRRKAREYVDGNLNLSGDELTSYVNAL